MGVPYEIAPVIAAVPSATVIAVDFPSRSTITAIKVVQTSGTPAAFDLELFNIDPTALPSGTAAENFYVCSKKTGSGAGKLLYFADESTGGHGYTFFSRQPSPSTRIQGNLRKIYVKITPSGGGGNFAISIAGHVQVGE